MYALIAFTDNDQIAMKIWKSHPGTFRINEFVKHWYMDFKPCKWYKLCFANVQNYSESEILKKLKTNELNAQYYTRQEQVIRK